jgi:hypothetical protein
VNGAEKPGQAAAHLLVVIKVEVLAQLCEAVTWPTCCQRIPENLFIAAQPLKRSGRGVVDLLVEQLVVAAGVPGAGHGGLSGAAALRYQSYPCAMTPARKSMKPSSEQPPPMR